MTESFVYESYYIVLFHVPVLFLLVLVNGIIFMKAQKSPLLNAFFIIQGILVLWMVSKLLKTFAPDVSMKFFFVVCQYAGVCFLGAVFVRFACLFATGKTPPEKLMRLLNIAAGLLFLVVLTNPLHHLFYSHFDFWGDSFGPLFYLHQALQFLLLISGILLCGKKYFAAFGRKRIQAILFTAAIFIPMGANLIYVFGLFRVLFGFTPPFDITPASTSISLLIFAFATFRLDFFDHLRIAHDTALSNIPEGILIIKDGNVSGLNQTLQEMDREGKLLDQDGNSLIQGRRPIGKYQKAELLFDIKTPCNFIYRAKDGAYMNLIYHPARKGLCEGAFIRFIDVSEKHGMLKDLQAKTEVLNAVNERLARQAEIKRRIVVMKTRNMIAQEAHDILGHSVMLAVSLLEMAKHCQDQTERLCCVERAKRALSGGMGNLRTALVSDERNREENTNLEQRLRELAGGLNTNGLAVEIDCSGFNGRLGEVIEDTVFKISREGITNALRHGNPGRIDVILRGGKKSVELFIIDNGSGCAQVKRGMGIRGMEQRIEQVQGSLCCSSLGGQGFCVSAVIPLELYGERP